MERHLVTPSPCHPVSAYERNGYLIRRRGLPPVPAACIHSAGVRSALRHMDAARAPGRAAGIRPGSTLPCASGDVLRRRALAVGLAWREAATNVCERPRARSGLAAR